MVRPRGSGLWIWILLRLGEFRRLGFRIQRVIRLSPCLAGGAGPWGARSMFMKKDV